MRKTRAKGAGNDNTQQSAAFSLHLHDLQLDGYGGADRDCVQGDEAVPPCPSDSETRERNADEGADEARKEETKGDGDVRMVVEVEACGAGGCAGVCDVVETEAVRCRRPSAHQETGAAGPPLSMASSLHVKGGLIGFQYI